MATYGHTTAMDLVEDKWAFRPAWDGEWFKAAPKNKKANEKATMPSLWRSAFSGSLAAESRPDGMYVEVAEAKGGLLLADVLALEHCGVTQNLHDKRSRYGASQGSLLLRLPQAWLNEVSKARQKRGRRANAQLRPTWEAIGDPFTAAASADTYAAISRLRVFFFVPDSDVAGSKSKIALDPHEYLLPHSALKNQYAPKTLALLKHAFHSRVWGE